MDMKVRAIDVKEVIWEFKKHSKEHCTAETGKCLGYLSTPSTSSTITLEKRKNTSLPV